MKFVSEMTKNKQANYIIGKLRPK